mmetsp:Transcript_154802/g.475651  ORF Transcript_154802/g.475651 Transcript_154802/m.475651 type:complete len:252 (+) Transcript_154802:2061-2816(+)
MMSLGPSSIRTCCEAMLLMLLSSFQPIAAVDPWTGDGDMPSEPRVSEDSHRPEEPSEPRRGGAPPSAVEPGRPRMPSRKPLARAFWERRSEETWWATSLSTPSMICSTKFVRSCTSSLSGCFCALVRISPSATLTSWQWMACMMVCLVSEVLAMPSHLTRRGHVVALTSRVRAAMPLVKNSTRFPSRGSKRPPALSMCRWMARERPTAPRRPPQHMTAASPAVTGCLSCARICRIGIESTSIRARTTKETR